MIMFVPEFVPPGIVYEDEPREEVPSGWHVRLQGVTDFQRWNPEWQHQGWPSVYMGRDGVDHFAAVVVAKIANDEWDCRGRTPEAVDASLREAVTQLMDRQRPA